MALSLERLGRNKDAIPVLESLLKIDRFDAELSKKLAFAIVDEDPDKSIHYMKLSIEGFIKNKKVRRGHQPLDQARLCFMGGYRLFREDRALPGRGQAV